MLNSGGVYEFSLFNCGTELSQTLSPKYVDLV